MGLALSVLASALWPLVSLVIPNHQLATAYGMYVMSMSILYIRIMHTRFADMPPPLSRGH